jgi:hypothetical protein
MPSGAGSRLARYGTLSIPPFALLIFVAGRYSLRIYRTTYTTNSAITKVPDELNGGLRGTF